MEKERIYIRNAVTSRSIKAVETVLKQVSTARQGVYLGEMHPCRPLDKWTKKSLNNFYEQLSRSEEMAFRLEYSSMGPLSSPLENDKAFPSHFKNIGEVKLSLINKNNVKDYNNENTNCYL